MEPIYLIKYGITHVVKNVNGLVSGNYGMYNSGTLQVPESFVDMLTDEVNKYDDTSFVLNPNLYLSTDLVADMKRWSKTGGDLEKYASYLTDLSDSLEVYPFKITNEMMEVTILQRNI